MSRGMGSRSLALIERAKEILDEIAPATVRAVCYRLFGERLIPDMSKGSTNRVSRLLTLARENGQIEWSRIVDESREAEFGGGYADARQALDQTARYYRRDYWRDQPVRVEVWSEKGTVRGTLAPVLEQYGVTFRVMHGYGSATTVNTIADESTESAKDYIALYVGDFDPSGMHMSEIDLPQRLERYGGAVTIKRVALTRPDTKGLLSFPAATKHGDARHKWFIKRYGQTCWELDAMSPPVLRRKVDAAIAAHIDRDVWAHTLKVEKAEQESMKRYFKGWKDVVRL